MLQRLLPLVLIGCSAIASGNPAASGKVPVLPVETLSEKAMILPADLPKTPCLFIIGFSKASSANTRSWSEELESRSLPNSVAIYSVAILEDVPGLFRGFAVRGIRRGVPEGLHGRFLVVTEQSAAWKDMASYAEPDAAYLVLVDKDREISWRAHGPVTEAAVAAVVDAVAAVSGLENQPAGRGL